MGMDKNYSQVLFLPSHAPWWNKGNTAGLDKAGSATPPPSLQRTCWSVNITENAQDMGHASVMLLPASRKRKHSEMKFNISQYKNS